MQLSPHKVKFAMIDIFIICGWNVKVESLRWQTWINTCVLVLGHSVAVLSCIILHQDKCMYAYLERWVNLLKIGGWLLPWCQQASSPLYFVCLICHVSTSQWGNREQRKVTRSQRQLSYSFYFNLSFKRRAHRTMFEHCFEKHWMEKYYTPTSRT